jgi:hypothetical protein
MPLPKSLRRPVRRASSSSTGRLAQRKRCHVCNNLDPRDHISSVYESEAAKGPTASLDLVLDALVLSRTKTTDCGGCRFCNVLVQTLDAFFEKWRGVRCRVNVRVKEKGTIKIGIDGERWKGEMVEIYAGSSRCFLYLLHLNLTTASIACPVADARICPSHSKQLRIRRNFYVHPSLHPGLSCEPKSHCLQALFGCIYLCSQTPGRCRPIVKIGAYSHY